MAEEEKRSGERKKVVLTSFIRKELAGGGYSLMQFISKDLSEGGIFVCADDLAIFDLGESVSLIVERGTDRYYEGRGRVVRSARIFVPEGAISESGFGVQFVDPPPEFTEMVRSRLAST